MTFTVNWQLATPAPVHSTTVVPTGKLEPLGGVHVTTPQNPSVAGTGRFTTAEH